ncbi:membrane protein MLC1 [Esox lucius]|uniref:Modulator of VRAC current 1 n=1 Tax=Esox lucius TaxID=8010 RepID=A0A6Q2YDJ0_ESOLU|nr:membrane protein MLC1 [Esox lucius]XP_028970680.1 membrane protein MLC1 [Esox lucius]
MMQRDDLSGMEEFSYAQMTTLERGATVARRGGAGRDRPESFTVDVRASDLQLAHSVKPVHPCLSYRTWLYSVLIGSSLFVTAGFSLYLGNVFPSAMDYLRCAAGSGIPAAVVSFAIAKTHHVPVSDYLLVFVSSFAVTTSCLVWFGCKLVFSPSAVNINFNLILLILLEVLMASTVILSARSADGKSVTYDGPVVLEPAVFPARLLKAYSVIEVIVGISAVFGGMIAVNMDALMPGPYLSVTFFWILVACFPSAIASHVAAVYPNRFLVETLTAITSITSPLLFSASGYLSDSVLSVAGIFLHEASTAKQWYDILLLIVMVLLLVQAVLTLATVIHCASYKSQLCRGAPEWNDGLQFPPLLSEQQASNGTLRDFDKDKAWKAVVVQMAQ